MTVLRLTECAAAELDLSAWAAVRAGPAGADEPVAADARCLLAHRGGEPVARAAFGVGEELSGAPGRTGYVGWYEAVEPEAGAAVLRRAADRLRVEGAERVVGPLNGSTWARYRLALPPESESETGPPFLAEPWNPTRYVADFAAAGFAPFLDYESRVVRRPEPDPEVEREVLPALASAGIGLRALETERYAEELRAIHRLTLAAFRANPLYSPLPWEAFAAQYERLRPLVDPELVRLAHDARGELVGYVFAYADPLAPQRVVLKTLASAAAVRGLGLGRTLVDAVHRAAAARGAEVIHALMHVSNASKRISTRSESELFRRYRLYRAGEG